MFTTPVRRSLPRTRPAARWLLALAALVAPTVSSAARAEAAAPIGEMIVEVTRGTSVAAVAARHGLVVTESSVTGAHLLTIVDGRTTEVVKAELLLDPAVELADVNVEVRSPAVEFSGRVWAWGATTTGITEQWAVAKLRLPTSATGAGVTVAVVDSGITASHPQLAGAVLPGIDLVDGDTDPADVGNQVDDNGNGAVDEAVGHGTHVSGIVHLVAPAAKILPVRVLDSDGSADTWTLVEGMRWAADRGAQVINVSAGQQGSSHYLRDEVDALRQRGVIVVAAAGNTGDTDKSFPAAAKCAISVTSSDPADRLSIFGARGSSVDVAAPGENIVSAFPAPLSASWSGTSMATPFVAGEVALIRSVAPGLSFGQTLAVVRGVSSPLTPTGLKFGRIDPARAVAAASSNRIPDPRKSGVASECLS